MLLDKTIITKWNPSNKKYYELLGYTYTKINDPLKVKIDDLSPKSHAIVHVECDYCGTIIERPWHKYLSQHDEVMGDACCNCKIIKTQHTIQDKYNVKAPIQNDGIRNKIKKTNLERYGCENPMQNKKVYNKMCNTVQGKYGCDNYAQTVEFIDKCTSTCLDKYGYEYAIQVPEIRQKIIQTNLKKYGYKNPMQSNDIKEKVAKTNLKKYGVRCSAQSEIVKDKMRQTNMNKYGVEYSCLANEVRQKAWDTLHSHGKAPVSKPESATCQLLIDLYGEKSCIPSKFVDYYTLDCEVNINGSKIDVEYDGQYWHSNDNAIKRDKKRDEYLQQQNYKILRIKANREVPTDEQLKNAIDYLVKGNHSYTEIILDI